MPRRIRKVLIVIGIIFAVLFIMWQGAKMMAPGSYVYAENYQLAAPESRVIEAVKLFKKTHPEMVVPEAANLASSEGRPDSSYWYFIYLYYPKENQIVLAWTRPTIDSLNTELAFVSINEGLGLWNWKQINKDFTGEDNKKLKAQFERRFVKELGIKYSDNGDSMSLW